MLPLLHAVDVAQQFLAGAGQRDNKRSRALGFGRSVDASFGQQLLVGIIRLLVNA